ncbi:MAG: hypothetical protein NT051_05465 [Candidatus Micrarchaeota archaeon]|nr:hypothetical protein [Candidatus Micrarchaeota archaeon]
MNRMSLPSSASPLASTLPRRSARRFFKKAVFCAKIAVSVAAFGWLAFQPLVSPAQGKLQQKYATSPLLASASKDKTASFSEAQKNSNANQVKYDNTHPYAGVRRILIELDSKPEEAQQLAHKYAASVDSIASVLRDSLKLGPQEEAKTGQALVDILYHKVKLSNADTTLAASELLNLYNCERLSMKARDILMAVGIFSELVAVEDKYATQVSNRASEQTIGHMFARTQHFIVDCVKDTVYAKENLLKNYRIEYSSFSDANSLQYSTYLSLGNCMAIWGKHDSALIYYEKAARLAPGVPFIFYNMGKEYSEALELEKSVDAYDKVIKIDPLFSKGFVPIIRGVVYSYYIYYMENPSQSNK